MHKELFETIRHDHREIESLLLRLLEAGEETARKRIFDQLLGAVLPHMIGEEQVVYPALRPDPEGAEVAGRAIGQHREAQDLLRRLRDHRPAEEDFDRTVRLLRERVEEHLREEEEEVFAALRRVVSERHAARLLESFRREKELAWNRYPDLPLPTTEAGEIRV